MASITKAVPEYLFSLSKPNKHSWCGRFYLHIQLLKRICTIVSGKRVFVFRVMSNE